MRIFSAGVLLLLASLSMSHEEATAIVQPTEYWSTVAAPPTAPRYATQYSFSHLSNYVWHYPYDKPSPGGVIEVSNCIIDADGRFGTLSQAVTLTVERGWQLWGGAWNQPIVEDAQGVAWCVKFISINAEDVYQYNPWQAGGVRYFYTGWGGSYLQNEIAPYSSHSPNLEILTEDAWMSFAWDKFPKAGRNTAVASAPPVVASNVPLEVFEVAYCRVTETGETALSPAHQFTPAPVPLGTQAANVCNLGYAIMDNHPQGTLGVHLYRRKQLTPPVPATETTPAVPATWGAWKRLPAPHCVSQPSTADDWLIPVWMRQVSLRRVVEGAPVHQAAAEPKSRLTRLHRLLRGDNNKDAEVLFEYFRLPDVVVQKVAADGAVTGTEMRRAYDPDYVNVDAAGMPVSMKRAFRGDVVVKPGELFTVHCPVVDEWGNNDQGTTGGAGDQKFKRRIRASNFGEWSIEQATSQSGHNSWPTLCVTNQYSRWIGCTIKAHGGDAVATTDYSGGQCFGNQMIECALLADSVPGRVTCGFRVDGTSSAWVGGHTASEWNFRDCTINSSIPLWLAGNQTANMRFDRLHANSYSFDSRGCLCYISYNPSPVNFFNGLYCDAYLWNNSWGWGRGVIFRADIAPATVQASGIWCDTGFTRFIEANNVPFQLKLTEGKLNYRGTKPLLALFTGTTGGKSTIFIDSVQTQPDPNTQGPYIISNNYQLAEFLYERTALETTILREPDADVAKLMRQRLFGEAATLVARDEPGYRVPIKAGLLSPAFSSVSTGAKVRREYVALPTLP